MIPSQPIAEWLREAIHYYRQLGFFKDLAQSDQELADLEEKRLKDEWGDDWQPPENDPDLFLLAHDLERVWWMDMEADVCDGNKVYVETLKEWGNISRGAFQPQAIREEWQSERGPIILLFQNMGKPYSVSPKYWGDFIDIDILRALNQIIEDTGMQFARYESFDQTAFVVALTAHEKRRLRFERGWKFMF